MYMDFGRTFVLAIALLVAMSVVLKLPAAAEWGKTFAQENIGQVASLLAALPPADEIDTILDSGSETSGVKKEAAKATSTNPVVDDTEDPSEQTIEVGDSEGKEAEVTIDTKKCTCPKGAAQCAECSVCGSIKWTDEPAQEGKELPKTNICYKKEDSCIVPEGGRVCSVFELGAIENALKNGGSVGYTELGSLSPQRLSSPTDPVLQSILYQNLFAESNALLGPGFVYPQNIHPITAFTEMAPVSGPFIPNQETLNRFLFAEPGSLSPSQSFPALRL
jgi:hypothetical protein